MKMTCGISFIFESFVRSSKPVFPTHINLNLQALPATNIPEQLRKSRRQQNFEIDKQLANRLTLQRNRSES